MDITIDLTKEQIFELLSLNQEKFEKKASQILSREFLVSLLYFDKNSYAKEVQSLYNKKLSNYLPKSMKITEQIMTGIKIVSKNRLKDIDSWSRYFDKVLESSFLLGDNQQNWRANLHWLTRKRNVDKVLEDNYTNIMRLKMSK